MADAQRGRRVDRAGRRRDGARLAAAACGAAALPLARRVLPETTLERRELWALSVGAVGLATFAVLSFGADQTPSRHWDGAVAWDVKNALLADDLTLDQAVFRDPAILHHSRDYPLGQPLLVAMVDRMDGRRPVALLLAWLPSCLAIFVCACRRRCPLASRRSPRSRSD